MPPNHIRIIKAMVTNMRQGSSRKFPMSKLSKDMLNIITALPSTVAMTNVRNGTELRPDTILISDEGEKGKHASRKSGVKPFRSTHLKKRSARGNLRSIRDFTLCPSLRLNQNTHTAPTDTPIQENRKPNHKPNMLALAATMTSSGRNGRKASSKGNRIPRKGPNCEKLSKVRWRCSRSIFLSCNHQFCLLFIVQNPTLPLMRGISCFHNTKKVSYKPIYTSLR